jgi:hypothetical protein
MSEIPESRTFAGPRQLWRFIAALQDAVRLGSLVQVPRVDAFVEYVDVRDLKEGQSWPGDLMILHFVEPSSNIGCRLFIDGYHGGANWKSPEESED